MTGKTHLIGGAATAAILIAVGSEGSAAMVGACLVGSILPDIDHFNSKISSHNLGTKIASGFISIIFGHRGFTHTPVFIGLVGLILYLMTKDIPDLVYVTDLIWPLGAGMLSHLLLDTLNPMGILWAWPISSRHISIAPIRTGSFGELIVAAIMVTMLVAAGVSNLTALIDNIL